MDIETYMDNWENNRFWEHLDFPHHKRRFKFLADNLEGQRFLDVGCAFGHSTYKLSRLRKGSWHGLDFSMRAVEKAAENFYGQGIKFYYTDSFDLLSCCGKFDSVVCSEVLDYVEEDWKLALALMRVTKQVLLVTVRCRDKSDSGRLRVYTADKLRALFKKFDCWIEREDPFFFAKVKHKLGEEFIFYD